MPTTTFKVNGYHVLNVNCTTLSENERAEHFAKLLRDSELRNEHQFYDMKTATSCAHVPYLVHIQRFQPGKIFDDKQAVPGFFREGVAGEF